MKAERIGFFSLLNAGAFPVSSLGLRPAGRRTFFCFAFNKEFLVYPKPPDSRFHGRDGNFSGIAGYCALIAQLAGVFQ